MSNARRVASPSSPQEALLVAGLLLMSGAVLPLFLGPPDAVWNPAGYPAVQILLLAFYGTVACLLARQWRTAVDIARRDPLLWLLMAWVVLSVTWSDVPVLTARRASALLLTTGVGLHIATYFEIEGQARIVARTLSVAAVLSILAVMFFPDYGIDQTFWRGPAWRGVYTQKNGLGRAMALWTASAVVLALEKRRAATWWAAVAGISAAFPFLARSLTALIAVLALYALLALVVAKQARGVGRLDRRQTTNLAAVVGLTIVVWIGLQLRPTGAASSASTALTTPQKAEVALVDRRETALGRINLWQAVGEKIPQRFWLGYGYGVFWREDSGPAPGIWSRIGWRAPSAHNGFLDVGLGLGVVGMLLMAAHLFRTGAGVIAVLRRSGLDSTGLWPISFFTFFCIYNLPETSMLVQNTLLWALYVAVALSCREQRNA